MLQTLKQGTSGDIVKVAQYLIGFSEKNKANGTFDSAFFDAVKSWQEKNGLEVDGVIGSKTWKKIAKSAPTCSTNKRKNSSYTCAVQILVDGIEVDGIYGIKTKKAVSAYQEAKGIEVDGICGPNTWKALITGSVVKKDSDITEDEKTNEKTINECVHYLQWDSRWKNKKYSTHTSKQTIGNSGCGPSAMAQIMATWIDPKITPVEMCELALKGGYRTYDSGTSGGFFKYVFKRYDEFEKYVETKSIPTLKAALGEGALAVCCMNSNDHSFWTSGGHYITAIGYDSDGYIYANDPNKKEHPRKQKEDKFKSCLKYAYIFWCKKKSETSDPSKATGDGDDNKSSKSIKRGDAIVDISKYQPNVDYDKFINATSLIILRAGYRGTAGGINEDQKFELHASEISKRGVRFGVYFYSIANTEDKAREEARMFYKYAKKYNPLFWAMDAEKENITKETIVAFVNELRNLGAKKVGCYVANHLYNKYDYISIKDKMDFTWIPRYSTVKPNHQCDMWQYTSTGTVEGINGSVDINRITGDGQDLNWFIEG